MIFTISPLGDCALILEFSSEINDDASSYVHSAYHLLSSLQIPGVIAYVPAYTTLTIHYDPCISLYEHIKTYLQSVLGKEVRSTITQGRCFLIPVCYETPFSIDLSEIAKTHKMSEEQIILHHTNQIYQVSFLGFSPGFPFLKGLQKEIATPRKENPRTLVKAGSVGIAGEQTGIYPTDSPGGWQIIGKTPIRIYCPTEKDPTLFEPGDLVRFYSITTKQYFYLEELYEYNRS